MLIALLCVVPWSQTMAAYGVQVGAFAQWRNAVRAKQRLETAGFPVVHQPLTLPDGRVLTVIFVGPYLEREQAEIARQKLDTLSWRGYVRDLPKTISAQATLVTIPQESEAAAAPGSLSKHSAQPIPPVSEGQGDQQEVLVFHEEGAADQPALEAGEGAQVLVFQEEPQAAPPPGGELLILEGEPQPEVAAGVIVRKDLRLEAGGLLKSGQSVDSSNFLHVGLSARWRVSPQWEFGLGARADGYHQTGAPNFDQYRADYGEIFARYRGDDFRLTVGSQSILWGRIDEVPPTDRLSVQDLSRFILDELPKRRRAVPALRLEGFRGDYKVDVVWVPEFRAAELPNSDSIWALVDRSNGRLLGVPDNAVLSQFLRLGSYSDDEEGSGGAGIRLSHSGGALDYALTIQRFKHSVPYYELNPLVRATYLSTSNVATALASTTASTFVARHPRSWLLGGDVGFTTDGAVWRFEAAYLSDVPATTADFRLVTLEGLDWMAGVEFYPGDGDTRVNLQLGGRHLLDAPVLLDRDDIYTLNGSVEGVLKHNRWRAKLRFSLGLDKKDIYLNPELAYIEWEPHEFYLAVHYFDGADGTLGGFHEDHSLVSLGWRAKY